VRARLAGAPVALRTRAIELEEPFVRVGDPTDRAFVREVLAGRRTEAVLA